MNFKIVKLQLLAALFFAILLAAPLLMTNIRANITAGTVVQKTATSGHPCAILLGDPVGGGGLPLVQPNRSRLI
jgi:hypothetical protein